MFFKECQKPKLSLYLMAAIFFCGLLTTASFAQNPDTLKINNVIGEPGQTVTVGVYLANPNRSIGGFKIVLSHNPNVLFTQPTWIRRTPRSDSLTVGSNVNQDTIRIIGADWTSRNPIPRGAGNILEIDFLIDEGARNGDYYIRFVPRSADTTNNVLSDSTGLISIYPVLIDGFVRVTGGGENAPPYYSPPLTSPRQTEVGVTLQFLVTAIDTDGDNITLSAANLPQNATFPQNEGEGQVSSSFSFTPATNQNNQTYNVVFIATDGFAEVRDTVVVIVGGGGNQAPTVSAPSSREVSEGAHLEFVVSATDPEGDFITLSATNLPANAYFDGTDGYGTVSDTFYFDPDYNQGGTTYTVTFRAVDGLGNTGQRQVDINVLDAINDLLEVASLQGALPGSIDRDIIVNMMNPAPIYAIQFDILFDPNVIDIKDAIADSIRAFDFLLFQNLLEDGRYRVGILPMSLDTIPAGIGPIVSFLIDVDQLAETGPSVVTFDSATTVHDTAGTSVEMFFDDGIFTVDILGDANLDGMISIGDCVAVLANMLGRLPMNIRASDAADFNRDGDVRISDLQGIIYFIFGFSVETPPLAGRMGTVEIIRENIYPGFNGEVPMWLTLDTEAAGVQFTIDYDPAQVTINDITPGNMVSSLNLDYTDTGDQIQGVIYTFNLTEFGPAIGELINLDVEFGGGEVNPLSAIRLTDFEIVTVDAHQLAVDVIGELPESFELYQNYPNPFNARTVISFDLPLSSMVEVSIYNVLGQKVKSLYSGYTDAGKHQMIWDGTGSNDENVTSGVYFYRLEADGFNRTKKMLMVK